MKLIDATELLKNEVPAKRFHPEALVVGKGHVLSAAVCDVTMLIRALERIAESESTGDLATDCGCMRALAHMALDSLANRRVNQP